jgi:hypothetical protein
LFCRICLRFTCFSYVFSVFLTFSLLFLRFVFVYVLAVFLTFICFSYVLSVFHSFYLCLRFSCFSYVLSVFVTFYLLFLRFVFVYVLAVFLTFYLFFLRFICFSYVLSFSSTSSKEVLSTLFVLCIVISYPYVFHLLLLQGSTGLPAPKPSSSPAATQKVAVFVSCSYVTCSC